MVQGLLTQSQSGSQLTAFAQLRSPAQLADPIEQLLYCGPPQAYVVSERPLQVVVVAAQLAGRAVVPQQRPPMQVSLSQSALTEQSSPEVSPA